LAIFCPKSHIKSGQGWLGQATIYKSQTLRKSHTERLIDPKFSGFEEKHNLVTTATKPDAENAVLDDGSGLSKSA
jgi:hypothetical protein